MVVVAVVCAARGQDGRRPGAPSLSSLVQALAQQESAPPISTGTFPPRPSHPHTRPVIPRSHNPPVRKSRFDPSPSSQSRFVSPKRDSLTPRKQPKLTQPEDEKTQPRRPVATAQTEFRFGSSKPRTSPRKPFLPNDRGARFDRKLLPHQLAAVTGKFSNPSAKTTKKPVRESRTHFKFTQKPKTTTKAPLTKPTTSASELVPLTDEEYEYLGEYYDEYYYYDYDNPDESKTDVSLQDKDKLISSTSKTNTQSPTTVSAPPKVSKFTPKVSKFTPNVAFTTSHSKTSKSESASDKLSLSALLSSIAAKREKTTLPNVPDDITEVKISNVSPVKAATVEPKVKMSITNTTESTFVVENIATSKTFLTEEIITEEPIEPLVEKDLNESSKNLTESKPSLASMFSNINVTPTANIENVFDNVSDTGSRISPKSFDSTSEPVKISSTERTEVSSVLDSTGSDMNNATESTPEMSKDIDSPDINETNSELFPKSESAMSNDVLQNLVEVEKTDDKPQAVSSNTSAADKKELLFASVFGNVQSSTVPSSLLPEGFDESKVEKLKPIKKFDISSIKSKTVTSNLLPEGFKLPIETKKAPANLLPENFEPPTESKDEPTKTKQLPAELLAKGFKLPIQTKEAPASLLPEGFKLPVETKEAPASLLPKGFKFPVETKEAPASLLPEGFKLPVKSKEAPLSLLPEGFNASNSIQESSPTTSRTGPGGLIFPKRIDRPSFLTTTEQTPGIPRVPPPDKPKIESIFDRIKTTTETVYVPRSTEANAKLGEIQAGDGLGLYNVSSTSTTTTTTTTPAPTTTLKPRPTTPGVCGQRCKLSGTLRIIEGAEWRPELTNRDTAEWQRLAATVTNELTEVYQRSRLNRWLVAVEVDAFNQGSVLVDYFLLLNEVSTGLDTLDLRQMMNEMLETSNGAGYSLGPYGVDPEATDFRVVKEAQRAAPRDDGGYLIPEWLIAVIVISLASFLFIIIFAITVAVSRARVNRRNTPLSEETINKLNASQLGLAYETHSNYGLEAYWDERQTRDGWEDHMARDMRPPSSRGGYPPQYAPHYAPSAGSKASRARHGSWGSDDWSGPHGAAPSKGRPEPYYGGAAGSSTYGDGGPYQRYQEDDDPFRF